MQSKAKQGNSYFVQFSVAQHCVVLRSKARKIIFCVAQYCSPLQSGARLSKEIILIVELS